MCSVSFHFLRPVFTPTMERYWLQNGGASGTNTAPFYNPKNLARSSKRKGKKNFHNDLELFLLTGKWKEFPNFGGHQGAGLDWWTEHIPVLHASPLSADSNSFIAVASGEHFEFDWHEFDFSCRVKRLESLLFCC